MNKKAKPKNDVDTDELIGKLFYPHVEGDWKNISALVLRKLYKEKDLIKDDPCRRIDMYGKVFDTMYNGTLYGKWEAIVTFQQMIVLCDADGVVDMTPEAMASRTSIPLEIIKKGISVLEAPDPYSRTPGQEGRRIELIDGHRPWGWHIVNHEKYKMLVDADTVREQNKERQRKHRASKQTKPIEIPIDNNLITECHAPSQPVTDKSQPVTPDNACNASSRYTDTDTDTDTDIKTLKTLSGKPDFDLETEFEKRWTRYPAKAGRKEAFKHFKATVTEKNVADLDRALDKYLIHLALPKNSFKSPQNGKTWFNNWQDWVDWIEPEVKGNGNGKAVGYTHSDQKQTGSGIKPKPGEYDLKPKFTE
jgi:hypothetical protein